MIMAGACGSPGTGPDSSPTPTPTSTPSTEQPGSAVLGQAAEDAGAAGDQGGGDNSDQVAAPQPAPTVPDPLQIEVTTSPPTASYPCHPSGAVVVSGGGGNPDSTEVTDSPEYPVEVTYQWFIKKAGPDPGVVPIGLPGTLQFNDAGGIPVSGPELVPAPGIEVELRVVEPETISGGWVAHPGCA
jgi:hypothetical protein